MPVVVVVVAPSNMPENFLRIPLAVGADQVFQVPLATWNWSAQTLAQVLARVVNELEEPRMILAGLQSGDWDSGLIPPALAAALLVGYIPNIVDIEGEDDAWVVTSRDSRHVRRFLARGLFVGSVASSGHNTLRYPTMPGRLSAKRKPVVILTNIFPPSPLPIEFTWVPHQTRSVEWIEGGSDSEKGQLLIKRLKKDGWLP